MNMFSIMGRKPNRTYCKIPELDVKNRPNGWRHKSEQRLVSAVNWEGAGRNLVRCRECSVAYPGLVFL